MQTDFIRTEASMPPAWVAVSRGVTRTSPYFGIGVLRAVPNGILLKEGET
jgi:hypothetical protein